MNPTFLQDFLLTFSLWNVCLCIGFAVGTVVESEDGKSGVINFSTPNLSDEEAHSNHMPEGLKCDGCLVVAYQMSLAFNKAQDRKPTKRLKESDIIDITETVCTKGFKQYGIKEVKGRKRLSGPGLPASDVPGIMQGGGKWPIRLQAMCQRYLEELGEDETYDAYREDNSLVDTLCYGKGIFGNCVGTKKDEL